MSVKQLIMGCVLWLCCCSAVPEGRERGKRELRFPKGGSLLAGVALASFFPKGPADGLAHVLEFDLGFAFPEKFTIDRTNSHSKSSIVKLKSKKKFRSRENLEDQRRKLLFKMEKALDRLKLDGSSCVSRFRCELRQISSGSSLLEELLSALFKPSTQENCYRTWQFACPFSFLQLIMHSQHELDVPLRASYYSDE